MPSNTFAVLIHQEEELLKRLVMISEKQIEIVRGGDISLLTQHLIQQHRLLNEFFALNEQLKPFSNIPPENRVWNDTAEKNRTGESINNINSMLQAMKMNYDIALAEASVQKTEIEEQLKKSQRTQNVIPAYVRQSKL